MTTYLSEGAPTRVITTEEKQAYLKAFVDGLEIKPQKVLLIPPDHTRLYSDAGSITDYLYKYLRPQVETLHIIPALGTHNPMTEKQLRMMFGPDIPLDAFLVHDWREGVKDLGAVPGEKIADWSEGKVDYEMKVMVSKILMDGGYDLILSIGQIVPHEVVGMANYTKNICVGLGGSDMINKSHFLGAVCNMESILGRAQTPVRAAFNYAYDTFISQLPIYFILTVIGKEGDDHVLRGLYIGDDQNCFLDGSLLSQKVNMDLLDEPLKKCVVYLTPKEFGSTWLGNKSVYRTRMVMADEGELIVLAPAVHEFGEDPEIDRLIRKYGYRGTPTTLKAVEENEDIRENLSAAAHLIHGSSEGRFSITYCTDPANMTREEVEGVGFQWADYNEMAAKYNPETLKDGVNTVDGEEIYYISNPALGLWALRKQFGGDYR